jgi:hypothetical protein
MHMDKIGSWGMGMHRGGGFFPEIIFTLALGFFFTS